MNKVTLSKVAKTYPLLIHKVLYLRSNKKFVKCVAINSGTKMMQQILMISWMGDIGPCPISPEKNPSILHNLQHLAIL